MRRPMFSFSPWFNSIGVDAFEKAIDGGVKIQFVLKHGIGDMK